MVLAPFSTNGVPTPDPLALGLMKSYAGSLATYSMLAFAAVAFSSYIRHTLPLSCFYGVVPYSQHG